MAHPLWRQVYHPRQPVPPNSKSVSVGLQYHKHLYSPNTPTLPRLHSPQPNTYAMLRPRTAQLLFRNSEESVSALPPPPTHSAEKEDKQPEDASNDELTSSMGTKPDRRRPVRKIIYVDEQEMDLAKWFRENPIFYDKGRWDYNDSVKKKAMYDLKGKSMDPPVAGTQIKSWLDSIRTRFSRMLARKKSEQDPPKFSDQDVWILSNFAFLKLYSDRENGRQCGVGTRPYIRPLYGPKGLLSECSPSSIPVTSEVDRDVEMVDKNPPRPTFAASTPQMKKRPRRIQEEKDIRDHLQKLQERSRGNEQVMSTVTRQLQPQSRHEAEIQSLMTFVTQQLMGVDPSLIDDVTDTFTQATRHFRKATRRIQEMREQKALFLSQHQSKTTPQYQHSHYGDLKVLPR